MSEGIRWIKKRNGRKEGKKIGEKGEKEANREREREKERGEKNMEIFQAFRKSELDGLRRKVDPRIASYAWVPKSWSFVKLYKVGNFPTKNIFSLKAMKWHMLSLGS